MVATPDGARDRPVTATTRRDAPRDRSRPLLLPSRAPEPRYAGGARSSRSRPEAAVAPPPPAAHLIRTLGAALFLVALVVASLWPLPGLMEPGLLGAPDQEAGEHLWALHAGLQASSPLVNTDLVSFPVGYRWVLADPLSLLPFGLGTALHSAEAGLLLVHTAWLLIAAAASAAWARELGSSPWAAASVAVVLSPLCSPLVTGITDAAGLGLTAGALLAAHRLGHASTSREVVATGILAGLTAWAGPYPALYLGLLAPALLVGRDGPYPWRAWLGAALLALLVASPMLVWTLWERETGLPGTESVLPAVRADPGAPSNLLFGNDPLALLLGGGSDPSHGGYLGVPLVGLAAIGVWRLPRRAWSAVAVALAATGLSLGFHLAHDGEIVEVGGRIIALPARALSELVPPLGRAPRWYRMAGVAGVVLAALAARGAARVAGARTAVFIVLVATPIVDHAVRGPLPWPRPVTPVPRSPLFELPGPGPVAVLPRADARRLRGQQLYAQVLHQHPTIANTHAQRRPRNPADDGLQALEAAARRKDDQATRAARQRLWALGLRWIAVETHRAGPDLVDGLKRALGPPDHAGAELVAWRAAH